MAAGVPADADPTVEAPVDPAADVGVSLADLRLARDLYVTRIDEYQRVLVHTQGRKAALDALIAPLEAELAKPAKRRARK